LAADAIAAAFTEKQQRLEDKRTVFFPIAWSLDNVITLCPEHLICCSA
jgi:hypothetical protein